MDPIIDKSSFYYKKEAKLMLKKGQAAMEFLMTYGWAILVVLIVIGALAYFGVLSPTQFLPRRCHFTQGLTCTDHVISQANGNLTILVTNGIGNDIQLTSLFFNTTDGIVDCPRGGVQVSVSAGDTATISTKACSGIPGIGKRIKGVMILGYVDQATRFGHNITGSLLTDVEP